MKRYLPIGCVLIVISQFCLAQTKQGTSVWYPSYYSSLVLDPTPDATANVSSTDFNGDGHLDILLVKGRHWPILDWVLLGDGQGNVRKAYELGETADRSYTGGLADFNGDGWMDVAISNDRPDKKVIHFNDGKGKFKIGSEFGRPEWNTRNLSVADINKDALPDIIIANRGNPASTSNYVCLNKGKGQFSDDCISVARYPATTVTPVDINKDGYIDLVVPYRDNGQSFVYFGNASVTFPDTDRTPFGPSNATIRVSASADFDGDTLPDIVTVDEENGVHLYLQKGDHTFAPGIMLADAKVVPYALAVADMNNDGKVDIIVGHKKSESKVLFNEGRSSFKAVSFGDSQGTVYGFAIGDFNEDGNPDMVVARSDASDVLYFGGYSSQTR